MARRRVRLDANLVQETEHAWPCSVTMDIVKLSMLIYYTQYFLGLGNFGSRSVCPPYPATGSLLALKEALAKVVLADEGKQDTLKSLSPCFYIPDSLSD